MAISLRCVIERRMLSPGSCTRVWGQSFGQTVKDLLQTQHDLCELCRIGPTRVAAIGSPRRNRRLWRCSSNGRSPESTSIFDSPFSDSYRTAWPATPEPYLWQGACLQQCARNKDHILKCEDWLHGDEQFYSLIAKLLSSRITRCHSHPQWRMGK
jgi:hypothetical protein